MSQPYPDAAYWAALSYAVRGRTLARLFKNFNSGEAAWCASQSKLAALGLHKETIERIFQTRSTLHPEAVWQPMAANHIDAVLKNNDHYPVLLAEIPDAPALLFVRGTTKALKNYCVALVGTRKFSDYGKAVATKIGRDLARAGVTVVSGLARGVDGLAHEAALDVEGQTVAVIGSGLDKPSLYPREHWRLAEAMVERGGCVLSEYPPGVGPERHHFPERNRIIAGVSLAVLVVEAPEKSGALITAYQALEYNREVMAVPGRIFDANAQGTNILLSKGATLVTSAADVGAALGLEMKERKKEITTPKLSDLEQRVLMTLNVEPQLIDTIVTRAALPISTVATTVTSLELQGFIKDVGGKQYIRVE